MQRPSRSFSWAEFLVSKEHPELLTFDLSDMDKLKIFYLCCLHLQPVREAIGKPILILSGKRSPELNAAVGGASASDHLFVGECAAVDFTIPGHDMRSVWTGLCLSPRSFGQCIFYRKSNFIHISLPSQKHQGESWEADK